MKYAHFAVGFFVGWLTLCLILVAVVADAAEIPKDVETTVDLSEQSDNNPVKIVTRTNVIYVWPCGQVAKEALEILNENEEQDHWRVNGISDATEYSIDGGDGYIVYDNIIDPYPEKTE